MLQMLLDKIKLLNDVGTEHNWLKWVGSIWNGGCRSEIKI